MVMPERPTHQLSRRWLLAIPLLTSFLTLALLVGMVLSWLRGKGSIVGSLVYVVIVVNSGVFVLPTRIAPAALSRATTVASWSGT